MLPVELPFWPLSLAAGLGHCIVLSRVTLDDEGDENHGIFSWGWNETSQLGREGRGDRPSLVKGIMEREKIVSVSCGRAHSVAVGSGGKVWAWGSGKNGRLGLESSSDEPEPACLESLGGLRVLRAACGFDHTLLLAEV